MKFDDNAMANNESHILTVPGPQNYVLITAELMPALDSHK